MRPPSRAAAWIAALFLLALPVQAHSAASPPLLQDPQPAQPDATRKLYLPLVSAPSIDVSVDAVEINQAVQTASGSVPLVQGRPAVARIFIKARGQSVSGLTVTLSATRNGVKLAGSPLTRTGVTALTSYNRAVRSHSINFMLPPSWLSGSVVLTANVALPNGRDSTPADNARRVAAAFRAVPALQITVVPIRYTHAPSGQVFAPPTSVSFPSSVRAMFPVPSVSVRFRAPIDFRGDLTYDSGRASVEPWEQLLTRVMALKQSDGAPASTVYVAVLPGAVMNAHRIYLAGLGSSARAVVNFDVALIPAHEIGHGFGRSHSPCGGAMGVDPNYPHAGGAIGAWGYHTTTGAILDPVSTTDLMSYCEEWVSDYTYVGMLDNQVAVAGSAAGSAAAEPALLVRALFGADGSASLEPLYALELPLTHADPASAYSVAYLDAQGVIGAAWPVDIEVTEEHGLAARFVVAALPRPPEGTAEVQLRHEGVILARRAVQSAQTAPAAFDASTLEITNPSGAPLLVRQRRAGRQDTLAIDADAASWSLAPAALAGGDSTIELVPADTLAGGSAASAANAALALPDQPPHAWIGTPSAALWGESLVIDGYASDPEDGTLDIEWAVEGQIMARGPLLQLESVTRPLTIELRTQDSAGQHATASLLVAPVQPPAEETPTE